MENRYWIDDNPTERPFGEDTCGVVDELAGGVIIYVGSLKLAELLLQLLQG